jgi:hypothetical protein
MTVAEINALYAKGERDFSEISVVSGNFCGANLSGAILKGANLSFSNFRDVNLNGADLTGANIEWSDFTRADLRNANMDGVRATWCRFNDAHFGKTSMRNANISDSIFLRADLYGGADVSGANTTNIVLKQQDLTADGVEKFKAQLGRLENFLDFDTIYYLQQLAMAAAEKLNTQIVDVEIGSYGKGNSDAGVTMIGYKMANGASGMIAYSAGMGSCRLGVYGR